VVRCLVVCITQSTDSSAGVPYSIPYFISKSKNVVVFVVFFAVVVFCFLDVLTSKHIVFPVSKSDFSLRLDSFNVTSLYCLVWIHERNWTR